MLSKGGNLSPSEVQEFQAFMSHKLPGHRRKLTGEEMSKLKKSFLPTIKSAKRPWTTNVIFNSKLIVIRILID